MVFLLIVGVIILVLLVGALLAFLFTRTDRAVSGTKTEIVEEEKQYNVGVTMGHRVKVNADYEAQLQEARLVAARKAAALPRGANNRIGSLGAATTAPASAALKDDPLTAVRIARFHGWDGARAGLPVGGVPAASAAPVAVAPAAAIPVAVELVPGRDYPVIEITDSMTPEEKRKAITANAKAKSAAMKAAKSAPATPAPAAAVGAPAGAVAAAAVPSAAALGLEPPKLIEITDSMTPEERRKATIANSKAQAAYSKALKAAGAGVATVPVATATVIEAAPVAAIAPSAADIGIAPPALIEITPDMSPEDKRKAMIANSKAQAAYAKALKAAGVSPGTAASAAVEAAPVQVAAAAPASVAAPAAPVAPGIEPPKLIEITPDMSPEEVRRARVENSKATAAYNKALKAAGIDPASLK